MGEKHNTMTVDAVHLSADAYFVCLTHALSTENEEIMGLLIGEVGTNHICYITSVMMLRRSDKQPDRVEISPEQLAAASTYAEDLAKQMGRPLRVCGWYHSHPHITVWPSHVDVRTQAMYQMMDESFVGLIFSVFNEDKHNKQNRIQITCFQSVDCSPEGEAPQYQRLEVPLHILSKPYIDPSCFETLIQLPHILSLEEEEAYNRTKSVSLDLLSQIQNSAIFTKSLCKIMEVVSGPLMQTLESRVQRNEVELKTLKDQERQLLKELNDY